MGGLSSEADDTDNSLQKYCPMMEIASKASFSYIEFSRIDLDHAIIYMIYLWTKWETTDP